MRFEVADNGCIGYVLASVRRGVVVVNNMEGVGTIDLVADALGPYTNALAQADHLAGVRSGLDVRKAWVLAELSVRDILASLLIEDRHFPHAEERLGKYAAHR